MKHQNNLCEPHITIVIPTKDRAQYLKNTLRTCEVQSYSRLSVIVSDDGSSDETKLITEEASRRDNRIRYVTPAPLGGMKANFEYALSLVSDGYVIVLGGDDGVMPEGVARLASLISTTGAQLLTWHPPIYTYPGTVSTAGMVRIFRRRMSRFIDSGDYLRRQADQLNYVSDPETPMFYVKGAISIDIVKKVRERSSSKNFYMSATPDGYSGIVSAGEVDKFWFESVPITIYGASPSSQGSAYLASDSAAKKRSESFFVQATSSPMSEELASQPYSPLITLMTADYLFTAKRLPGWPGNFGHIDFRKLIRLALAELANGLYSEARISRELTILRHIADAHGLRKYFRSQIESIWKFATHAHFDTDGFNGNSVLMSCEGTHINDVLAAANFVQSYLTIREKTTVGKLFGAITRSISFKWKSRIRAKPLASYLDPDL